MFQSVNEAMQRELATLDGHERYAITHLHKTHAIKWMDRIIVIKEQRAKLLGLHITKVSYR